MSEIDELRQIFEKTTLKADDFAARLGINRGSLYNILKSGVMSKRVENAFIRVKSDLSKGMNYPDHTHENAQVKEGIAPYGREVPVYDIAASAGTLEQYFDSREFILGHINMPSFSKCIAFIMVRGDSMYPVFKSGDLVGLQPTNGEIIQYGQPYMIVTNNSERMIKYLRQGSTPEKLLLKSANDHFEAFEIDREKVIQYYMVKGPIRDDWQ